MLKEIKLDLADNYRGDEEVLENLINDVTNEALHISNRPNNEFNRNILKIEIKDCVKRIYLQRGQEDTASVSSGGISSNFIDAFDRLRNDIIKNGKRILP